MNNVVAVSAGRSHTAAITSDGVLWTWGLNSYGQLGTGTTENSLVPVKVMDNVVEVSAGTFHTSAITSDGVLWTWGHGLGESSTTPVKVMDNVVAVSAGWAHTTIITSDGALWHWRAYAGSGLSSSTPVKMLDNVVAVSVGDSHTAAITYDGNLWAWGSNEYGQLGNGGSGNDTQSWLYSDGSEHKYPIQTVPIKIMDNIALPRTTGQGLSGPTVSWDEFQTLAEGRFFIRIYTSKPTFSNKVGESFQIYCTLYNEDGQIIPWTNPSIVVDNNNLVYLSGYSNEKDGFYFDVKGLTEGQAKLTITDSKSGVYATIPLSFGNGVVSPYSCRVDQVPNFGVEEHWTDVPTQTNFYNVSGLYVNGFTQTYNQKTDEYDISFSVYNSTYINGAVDIYDAAGKWTASEKIEKSTGAHSIQDTFKDGWNLLVDLVVEKKGLSYTLSSSTKETPIKISVPKGGYFTISNNFAESPGTYLYNMIDYIVLSANTIWDLAIDTASGEDLKITALTSVMKDKVFTLSSLTDDLAGELKSYALNTLISAGEYNL